jgi:DNA-binding LacI/PurR family transcriptional regulator
MVSNHMAVNRKKLTILDIAHAGGVSVSTVSRILNGKSDVSEKTRQNVLKIIQDMGYTPHAQAQHLASGKSRAITLLFSRTYADFSQVELDFIAGVAIACAEEDYFFNLNVNPVTETNLLNLYHSRQVDGVILMEIDKIDWRVELLRETNLPFTMIGHCENNAHLSFVDLDHEAGIQKVFDYLINQGHRQIAFLSYPKALRQKQFTPTVQANQGYEKAIQKYGIARICREVAMTQPEMMQVTLTLLDEYPDLTSVVSFNGIAIVGVFKALYLRGKHVPQDFSVIGLSTEQAAQMTMPSLTSLDIPARQMGYDAAKILIRKLNGSNIKPIQKMMVPELIIRESSASARMIGLT